MSTLSPHDLLGFDAPPDVLCTTPDRMRIGTEDDLSARRPVALRATVDVETRRAFHVCDVTGHARDLVAASGVHTGRLTVFSPHTTCAVRINERETCFLEDFRQFMQRLVPPDAYYRHDDLEIRTENLLEPESEPVNGHAHIKAMLIGSASETVPVADGALLLGTWQRIMFIELDQARPRRVHLHVQGWR